MDDETLRAELGDLNARVLTLEAAVAELAVAMELLTKPTAGQPRVGAAPKIGRGKHGHLTHDEAVEKVPDYVVWMHDDAASGTFQSFGFSEQHYEAAKKELVAKEQVGQPVRKSKPYVPVARRESFDDMDDDIPF